MTNFDAIKEMNFEQLAFWLRKHIDCGCCEADCPYGSDNYVCINYIKKWLNEEWSSDVWWHPDNLITIDFSNLKGEKEK